MPEAGVTEYGEGTVVVKTPATPEAVKVVTEVKSEYSDIEKQAIEQGWDPNYDGDNKRSAREFVDRGELLGKIKSQSAEIKAVHKLAAELSQHNKNVQAAAYEQALEKLKEAKVKALDEGKHGKTIKLDDAIEQTKTALRTLQQTPVSQPAAGESPEFQQFQRDNPLYATDEDFQAWTHGIALRYAKNYNNANGKQATEQEVYDYITKEARKEQVKQKFVSASRKGPPSPDGEGRSSGGNSGTDKSGSKAFDALLARLPEEHARVAKDLVKRGYVTKEKYVSDYQTLEG